MTDYDVVEVLAALADPIRLRMVQMLMDNPTVACVTLEQVFHISKSTISYHVKALKFAGLISVTKEGRFYCYTLRRALIEQNLPNLLSFLESLPRDPAVADGPPVVSPVKQDGVTNPCPPD
jgi:DNA-binding transcriptional ArsR family regulator